MNFLLAVENELKKVQLRPLFNFDPTSVQAVKWDEKERTTGLSKT